MKNKGTAYLFWLLGFFGVLGLHHFYLRKFGKGTIWILTGGLFGFGSLIDLFTLGGDVERFNTNEQLNTIRTNALKNVN